MQPAEQNGEFRLAVEREYRTTCLVLFLQQFQRISS